MKLIILSLVIILTIYGRLQAQELKPETNKQFMQVTTVESVVAGGLGRSKMIITHADEIFIIETGSKERILKSTNLNY